MKTSWILPGLLLAAAAVAAQPVDSTMSVKEGVLRQQMHGYLDTLVDIQTKLLRQEAEAKALAEYWQRWCEGEHACGPRPSTQLGATEGDQK